MLYTPIETDDPLIELLWNCMQHHIGYDKRISRKALVAYIQWNMDATDRQVRDAIAELPIISTSKDGGGYWIPANDAEFMTWCGEMNSRAKQIFKRVRLVNDYMKREKQPVKYEQKTFDIMQVVN